MAASLRIPTEFTAVDRFSSVVSKMTAGVSGFTKTTGAAVDRVNNKMNSVYGGLNSIAQIGIGVGIGGLFVAAGKSLTEYEDGVAQFRTIVSDLSDKDFEKYKSAIAGVAGETKKSTVDVVSSFEKIAGLNADFAKTSEGLAAVSKAAITLSKASKDELGASAENLVGIMNQFNLGAEESDRVINVLAAGQAVGAASITQSAEAYKNFGTVAKGANITLEQSQGLIQTVAKKSIFGAEAGTKLRGATLQLQKAGLGYKSGMFNINDALDEANKKTSKLTTAKEKDAYLTKTFGAENLTVGKILLENIDTYQKFTDGVTGTSEAQKAAQINTATLSAKWDELKNSAVNFVTTNDQANKGLNIAKDALGFVADNITTVINVGLGLLGFIALIKGLSLAFTIGQAIIAGYTLVTGAYSAVAVTAALTGSSFAVVIWATLAPILAVIAAVAAIIAIFYYWDEIVAWFGKQWESFTGWISGLWDSVVSFFQEFSFVDFFISIGQAIIEYMLFPLKSVLKLVAMIPGTVGEAAQSGLDKLNEMTDLSVQLGREDKQTESPSQVASANAQSNKMQGSINMNINDKGNNLGNVSSDFGGIPVTTTTTQGAF